jgi:hypothetical protein
MCEFDLQGVVGINLANQTGREGRLSSAYADAVAAFADTSTGGFRLEPFDFHKQCGATNYARLGILWEVRLWLTTRRLFISIDINSSYHALPWPAVHFTRFPPLWVLVP